MKQILFFVPIFFLILETPQSQSVKKSPDLLLYLCGGVKLLAPKHFGHDVNISPNSVPTIGGGAIWQLNKFQFGGEFNFTDGKKQATDFGTIFTGINFNLIAGYRYILTNKIRLGFQTGFGYGLSHLSVTDKHFTGSPKLNTAIYHNLIYTVPLALTIQRISSNGILFEIQGGYHFNVIPNEWRYMKGSSTEIYTGGIDGFFVKLVVGGLLKLNKTAP